MEYGKTTAVQDDGVIVQNEVCELDELQLALIGGGIGETTL
jgi:hypothetical protein